MLIEIHMLKNFAPTNLNRDDTGSPKTCMFGGVQRGRISSQCLKYSWRTASILQNAVGEKNIACRTRKMPDLIEEELLKRDVNKEYIPIIKKALTDFGKSDKKGKDEKSDKKKEKAIQTAQIIAYSAEDIQTIADLIITELKDCKNINEVKKFDVKKLQEDMSESTNRAVTLDMALFGRMVTSKALVNVEASMQVAHAISTNRVFMESDYFTAVDDLINESDTETGSAMIDDIDYNSSCYYIYASLDTDKLYENLVNNSDRDEIIKTVVPELVRTMALTNPSGKQNSFGGHSLPSAVLVECKECHIPVSYANAYEEPVKPTGGHGLIHPSVVRLMKECEKTAELYGIPVEKRLWFTNVEGAAFEDDMTVNCRTFAELLEQLPIL